MFNIDDYRIGRGGRQIDILKTLPHGTVRSSCLLFLLALFILGCSVFESDSQGLTELADTIGDTVVVNGESRTFLVHAPNGLTQPAPLVFAFHGKWGQGQDQLRLSGLNEVAASRGFIVVYPDGKNKEWDAGIRRGFMKRRVGDDMAFVRAMVEKMQRDYRIDPKRIYATGMSNGASFVHRLACEMPETIAAVAAVAGTIAPTIDATCQPSRPISIMQISGTDDPIVPYGGNLILRSVDDTVDGWRSRNECGAQAAGNRVTNDIEQLSYSRCEQGTEVVLYRVEGGGHTWPGGWQYAPVSVVGSTTNSMNASDRIWQFFAANPMP